ATCLNALDVITGNALTGTTGTHLGTSGRNVCLDATSICIIDNGITGVTNGITKVGSHSAKLGGNIIENTCLTPTNGFNVRIGTASNYICVTTGATQITEGTNVIFANNNCVQVAATGAGPTIGSMAVRCSTGEICMSSVNTTCSTTFCMLPNTVTSAGCPATFAGIQYGADYSANFTNCSLITKGYAATISGATAAAACAYAHAQDAIVSAATLTAANNYTDACATCLTNKINYVSGCTAANTVD